MKAKIVGLIIIVVGALPFLLKISSINNAIGKYTWILPGEIIYQIVLIILGIFLLWDRRPRNQMMYQR